MLIELHLLATTKAYVTQMQKHKHVCISADSDHYFDLSGLISVVGVTDICSILLRHLIFTNHHAPSFYYIAYKKHLFLTLLLLVAYNTSPNASKHKWSTNKNTKHETEIAEKKNQ